MSISVNKYIIFLLFILALAGRIAGQENKVCEYCKKAISGNYTIVDGKAYHSEHFLCAKCNKQITGNFAKKEGKYYHPDCYFVLEGIVCSYCKKTIEGEYIISGGLKYHQDCYENNVLAKCSVCGKPLSGKHSVDMYGNKFHSAHLNELSKCDCCDRLISQALTNGGKVLPDGRHICNLCYASAVFSKAELERSLYVVAQKLISMGLKLDMRRISVIGVDRTGLKKQATNYTENMQGYCNSKTEEEYLNNKLVKQNISHVIYVLTGNASTALESVMAHELMHSWLYENTPNNHPSNIREGACNYISYLYLKSLSANTSSDFLKKLENNPDPVYGGGFREIRNRFSDRPLNELLSYLKGK